MRSVISGAEASAAEAGRRRIVGVEVMVMILVNCGNGRSMKLPIGLVRVGQVEGFGVVFVAKGDMYNETD